MNEKITELIEQANIGGMADLVDCEAGVEGLGARLLTEFAELIVKECLRLCSDVENDPELSAEAGTFHDGALLCAEEIKTYFGVK